MTTLAAQTERVACPYCASTIANPVRQSADIVECLECGTVYLRTRLRPEVLYALYQNYAHEGSHMRLPKTRQEIEQSGLRREEFVRLVLEFIEPGGIWLDIGCGWGAMLDHVGRSDLHPAGSSSPVTVLILPRWCSVFLFRTSTSSNRESSHHPARSSRWCTRLSI